MSRTVYVRQHRSGMWAVRAEYKDGSDVCHYLYPDRKTAERTAKKMRELDTMPASDC